MHGTDIGLLDVKICVYDNTIKIAAKNEKMQQRTHVLASALHRNKWKMQKFLCNSRVVVCENFCQLYKSESDKKESAKE